MRDCCQKSPKLLRRYIRGVVVYYQVTPIPTARLDFAMDYFCSVDCFNNAKLLGDEILTLANRVFYIIRNGVETRKLEISPEASPQQIIEFLRENGFSEMKIQYITFEKDKQ